jgi:hypothetical protein
MSGKKTASAEELDRLFESGEDMGDYFDFASARPAGRAVQRVNVDFPQWMVAKLDAEAKRRGVTRQALIKMWLSDRLDRAA